MATLGLVVTATACHDVRPAKPPSRPLSRNQAPFEGGNIGPVRRRSAHRIDLQLRSDNDDKLPKVWRQWWYAKLDRLPVDAPVQLTVRGHGQTMYYLPVYSYDNKTWRHFAESEVTQPAPTTLRIKKRFARSVVWLARYNPYTYSTLTDYLAKLRRGRGASYIELKSIGATPEGRAIPLLTVTDPQAPARGKRRVVVHARTHPGEVASSFLLEGLIDALVADDRLGRTLRRRLVFDIVPMLNVDGVVAGNNRVTPRGVNLEGKWLADPADPRALADDKVPAEVRLFHAALTKRLKDGIPVTVALNLHSSGGTPGDQAFFFPHFGERAQGYTARESRLWRKQLRFVDLLQATHGAAWFNPLPAEGTRAFIAKAVPESWWWRNYADQVMALSIESTYGRAPHGERG
jgi:hypothetical protein